MPYIELSARLDTVIGSIGYVKATVSMSLFYLFIYLFIYTHV